VEDFVGVRQTVKEFAHSFSSRNEMQMAFTEEAIDLMAEKVWEEGGDVEQILRQSFQNYDHGLKLIREKTGTREFLIPPEGIENPDVYLNRLIREIYKDE